jgi:hypothetical protein
MAYSITTKDGITINNIPDDVAPDSPDLKARVAAIRAGGGAAALEAAAAPAPAASAETTLQGITGAITRGVAPIAAGATLGAAAGLPLAGVGAIPGAVAGAGAEKLASPISESSTD